MRWGNWRGILLPAILIVDLSIGNAEAAAWKAIPNPICDRDRATALSNSLGWVNNIDELVPQVPPEEVAYFEKEEAGSLKFNDAARFNVIAARPNYSAWKLHLAIAKARNELNKVKDLPPTASPKMRIQASAKTHYAIAKVLGAWRDYSHSPLANTMSEETQGKIEFQADLLASSMGSYEWCWAYLLPD